MEKYALIGERLSHSYSALIHRRFFELRGLDCSYELTELSPEELENNFDALTRKYCGLNVTIPYKQKVIAHLSELTPEAEKIGAVNTIKPTPSGAVGANTDYLGLKLMLEENDICVKGKRAVILGTGGASKAVCVLCRDLGASDITVVTRNKSQKSHFRLIDYSEQIKGDILFNTTPVGMYPNCEGSPLASVDSQFGALVDLIYNPCETALMRLAKKSGVYAVNGLYMLVAQAICSQSIWREETADKKIIQKIYGEMKDMEKGGDR